MNDVIVESPTAQIFLGERYYLCGNYYQRNGKRLHRTVWEYHNGPIPKGFHVHHRDHDRANNQPGNLTLVEGSQHLRHHATTPERLAYARRHMELRMRPKASEWHKSPEGRAWHSRNAEHVWASMEYVTKACVVCGKPYETPRPCAERSKFCHQNCRAADLRKRRRLALAS